MANCVQYCTGMLLIVNKSHSTGKHLRWTTFVLLPRASSPWGISEQQILMIFGHIRLTEHKLDFRTRRIYVKEPWKSCKLRTMARAMNFTCTDLVYIIIWAVTHATERVILFFSNSFEEDTQRNFNFNESEKMKKANNWRGKNHTRYGISKLTNQVITHISSYETWTATKSSSVYLSTDWI